MAPGESRILKQEREKEQQRAEDPEGRLSPELLTIVTTEGKRLA